MLFHWLGSRSCKLTPRNKEQTVEERGTQTNRRNLCAYNDLSICPWSCRWTGKHSPPSHICLAARQKSHSLKCSFQSTSIFRHRHIVQMFVRAKRSLTYTLNCRRNNESQPRFVQRPQQ